MTERIISVGTPVRFKPLPREGIGNRHRGHIVRVLMPGTSGVPEPTATYAIFDERTGLMRYLKRREFQTARKRGRR